MCRDTSKNHCPCASYSSGRSQQQKRVKNELHPAALVGDSSSPGPRREGDLLCPLLRLDPPNRGCVSVLLLIQPPAAMDVLPVSSWSGTENEELQEVWPDGGTREGPMRTRGRKLTWSDGSDLSRSGFRLSPSKFEEDLRCVGELLPTLRDPLGERRGVLERSM